MVEVTGEGALESWRGVEGGEELVVEVTGEGALESWRGVEGGEELVVEVTGEGALESWRGRRGDHLPTERTCGAVGEPSVDAWRVEGVHAREEEVARGGGRS